MAAKCLVVVINLCCEAWYPRWGLKPLSGPWQGRRTPTWIKHHEFWRRGDRVHCLFLSTHEAAAGDPMPCVTLFSSV